MVRAAIARTRASSALSTATPVGGSASTSSPFAWATPSMPPSSAVWAAPTTVTTPTVGRATPHSRAICPRPRMPISSTMTSVSSGLSRMVTGRPCSLLKLRGLAAVRRVLPSAAASRSLVEVLPTDPVTPTTASGRRERAQPPSAISAAAVSSTSITVQLGREAEGPDRTAGERRSGAGREGVGDVVVPVAGGDDRHEQRPRPQRAGVERGALDPPVGPVQPAARGGRGLAGTESHRRPYRMGKSK